MQKLFFVVALTLSIALFGCASSAPAPAKEQAPVAKQQAPAEKQQAPAEKQPVAAEKPAVPVKEPAKEAAPKKPSWDKVEKLKVGYPTMFPAIFDAQVFMAKELGVFQKYGLDVEFVHFRGDDLSFKALQAGEFDISNQSNAFVYIAREAGSNIKAFFESSPSLNWAFVTKKEIATWKDFEGKSLAVSVPGNVSHLVAIAMLKQKGVDTSKVQIASVGSTSARAQALVAGKVDASLVFVENGLDLIKNPNLKIFAYSADVLPSQFGTWVAKEDVLQKRRDQAVRFTAAVMETVDKVRENKKQVVDYYSKLYKMDEAIVSQAYDIYLKSGHFPTDGGMNAEGLKNTTQQMLDDKQLKRLLTYDEVYDTTIYKEAVTLKKEMAK